jgi:tetratricopeptide (TPR) repeat protein
MTLSHVSPVQPPSSRSAFGRGLVLMRSLSQKARKHPGRTTAVIVALLVLSAAGATVVWLRARQSESSKDEAVQHWQQAKDALAAQDYAQARTHLEQCLQLCPLDAEAHFLLARACRQTDDPAGCQAHLARAALLQWPRDEIQLESALLKAQSGDLGNVEAELLHYLDARPAEEVLIVEALVRGYLEAFRFRDVVFWTGRWMEHYRDDARPWVYRGRAAYLGRSPSRAVADYEHALQLNPDQAEAHLQLAGVWMVQRQFDKAIPHFEAYLRMRPDDAAALVGLANCSFSLGQTERARAALEPLFARHQADAGAYLVRAKLELAAGAAQEALNDLRQAEALAPHEIDVIYTLITVLTRLGKQAEAQKYQAKLKEVSWQINKLESLRKQINKEPENVSLRHEAGKAALALNQKREAVGWFMSVLQLDPKHAAAQKILADLYQERAGAQRGD